MTTSESAKQTLSGKKLVPPVNGTIKVACALSKDVTPIDWVGPQAVFGAWLYDESLKRDRPLFEVFTVGESRQPVDQCLILDYTYNEARLQLSLLAYNLGNLWRRLMLPKRIDAWSLTSSQQRLVKTGGRLIKHARYYWLLLAESHLTRRLFGSMLGRIAALPSPAG